jgi:hypothetical protein
MLYQDFSETRSERSALHAGVRAFGLHACGAVCAITLLFAGLYVTSRYFPHSRIFEGFNSALGLLNDDEPAPPSRGPTVAIAPEPPKRVVPRRSRARIVKPEPVRARLFAPPPARLVPAPELIDEGPVMMAVAMDSVAVSAPEFVLPARPRSSVVKILSALSFPFRFIGGFFGRQLESSTDPDDPDVEE